MGEMRRAIAREDQERQKQEHYSSTVVHLAAVRLARDPDISRPSPRSTSVVNDSIALAPTSLGRVCASTRLAASANWNGFSRGWTRERFLLEQVLTSKMPKTANHCSHTLERKYRIMIDWGSILRAGDGRDSPLTYTRSAGICLIGSRFRAGKPGLKGGLCSGIPCKTESHCRRG